MKTMLMTIAMAAAALAQGAVQEGNRTGERVTMQQEGAAGGTLLDMIDGTGGGWFYSMEAGGGAMKVEGGGMKAEVVRPAKGSGGGMGMRSYGGGTLLDLVDR